MIIRSGGISRIYALCLPHNIYTAYLFMIVLTMYGTAQFMVYMFRTTVYFLLAGFTVLC